MNVQLVVCVRVSTPWESDWELKADTLFSASCERTRILAISILWVVREVNKKDVVDETVRRFDLPLIFSVPLCSLPPFINNILLVARPSSIYHVSQTRTKPNTSNDLLIHSFEGTRRRLINPHLLLLSGIKMGLSLFVAAEKETWNGGHFYSGLLCRGAIIGSEFNPTSRADIQFWLFEIFGKIFESNGSYVECHYLTYCSWSSNQVLTFCGTNKNHLQFALV